jgi:hypothetical protein
MFQFSPLAPRFLWIQKRVTAHDGCRVSPFGHPRINAYVRLPEDYRSLSRPSSPVRAKASTVRPCSLDRIFSLVVRRRGYPAHLFLRTRVVLESSRLFTQFLNPGFQTAFSQPSVRCGAFKPNSLSRVRQRVSKNFFRSPADRGRRRRPRREGP